MSVRPQAKDMPAPVNFQWDDPFMLDEQLTEDERMIRDTARAYAQARPRAGRPYPRTTANRATRNVQPGEVSDGNDME